MTTSSMRRRVCSFRGWNVNLEINPHDIWIGCFWIKGHYYICPVPCVVIHVFKGRLRQ